MSYTLSGVKDSRIDNLCLLLKNIQLTQNLKQLRPNYFVYPGGRGGIGCEDVGVPTVTNYVL